MKLTSNFPVVQFWNAPLGSVIGTWGKGSTLHIRGRYFEGYHKRHRCHRPGPKRGLYLLQIIGDVTWVPDPEDPEIEWPYPHASYGWFIGEHYRGPPFTLNYQYDDEHGHEEGESSETKSGGTGIGSAQSTENNVTAQLHWLKEGEPHRSLELVWSCSDPVPITKQLSV